MRKRETYGHADKQTTDRNLKWRDRPTDTEIDLGRQRKETGQTTDVYS